MLWTMVETNLYLTVNVDHPTQLHSCLLGSTVCFLEVAPQAAKNAVLEAAQAALGLRNDVVNRYLVSARLAPAILAAISVTLVEVLTVEHNLGPLVIQFVVREPHYFRQTNWESCRLDGFTTINGQIKPLRNTVLRVVLVNERRSICYDSAKRFMHGHSIVCLKALVKHQNWSI